MSNDDSQSGDFINQALIVNSEIISIKNIDQRPICKIIAFDQFGSGCFIELKRNNKPIFCLLTAAHVIKNNKINIFNKDIEVFYNNENNYLTINLNKDERFIRDYSFMGIDAFLIEIIEKDNVDKNIFLKPNLDFIHIYKDIRKSKNNYNTISKGKRFINFFWSN